MGGSVFINVVNSVNVHIVGITTGQVLQTFEYFGLRFTVDNHT